MNVTTGDVKSIDDTIVAIASPLSPARRGIVRVSGNDVVSILRRLHLLTEPTQSQTARRFSCTLDLLDPLGSIDVDVMLWPTRRSYTGQPSAEFHTIGSLPIIEAVVERLIDAGARAARPGEFTMRAFLAGRMDLTQAEAVLGVIDAEDPKTLDRALSQLAGNLSRPLQNARSTLLNLLADVEAGLDFVDEDIEFIEDGDLVIRLTELLEILAVASVQLRERSEQKSSVNVVLRGLPNAGKSCLLNTLTQTDTAIVTDQAGTTRDVITVHIQHRGHSFSITDTAGIENRSRDDVDFEVMSQAQSQADEAIRRADICLWCIDASASQVDTAMESITETVDLATEPQAADLVEEVHDKSDLLERTTDFQSVEFASHRRTRSPSYTENRKRSSVELIVQTKSDLVADTQKPPTNQETISVSSVTGEGIASLWDQLLAMAQQHDATETGGVMGTAARCRDSLQQAIGCIESAIASTQNQVGHELVAAEMRSAVGHLGEVTGAVYTDDILDRVFSRFCIGK